MSLEVWGLPHQRGKEKLETESLSIEVKAYRHLMIMSSPAQEKKKTKTSGRLYSML